MTDRLTLDPPELGPADPRPRLMLVNGSVLATGGRCTACGYALAVVPPRCPVCGGATMEIATFGPGATVFTATILRIPVPGREPPYGLAYVDLDGGPRILVHVIDSETGETGGLRSAGDGRPARPLVPGSRVRLVGWTEHGDPAVRPSPEPTEHQRTEEAS